MSKPAKKEVAEEIAIHTAETLQRAVLGFLPGLHLVQEFLDFRSNLKQKRILSFADGLKTALEGITGEKIYHNNFTTEAFVDVMEEVFRHVQNTKSEFKLERFRNILVHQIINPPLDSDLTLKFVRLLSDLHDVQIHILNDFRNWEGTKIRNIILAYEGEIGVSNTDEHVIQSITERVGYNVTKAQVEYFTNELMSMGLIHNSAKVITSFGASSPQNNFKITLIGKRFLELIES